METKITFKSYMFEFQVSYKSLSTQSEFNTLLKNFYLRPLITYTDPHVKNETRELKNGAHNYHVSQPKWDMHDRRSNYNYSLASLSIRKLTSTRTTILELMKHLFCTTFY
jgi:hypothetical protein